MPRFPTVILASILPLLSEAAPVATPDSISALEDTELTPTTSVLDNDTTDGPTLTASLVSPPTHGALALATDGFFTYIPHPQYNGLDQFSYVARESDDRPVTLAVDQSRSQVEFTATINDPDLGSRTDTDTSSITGTAVAQLSPARAPLDDVQIIDFAFTLADGADLTFNFGFFVGRLNVHVDDDDLNIAMQTPGRGDSIDAENKFSQPDNDVRITGTADITASGTISLVFGDTTQMLDALETIDITDAVITEAGSTLTLSIPIKFVSTIPIDDTRTVDVELTGQIVGSAPIPPQPVDSQPATVTIDVTPTDDGPVSRNDAFSTPFGLALTRDAAAGLLANDFDLDLNPLTASLASAPSHGTVNVNLDGSFTYTPTPGFSGQDTFTYAITDSKPPFTVPILAAGSIWRYLDDGSDQGTVWSAADFDDSTWKSGPAILGYGNPGQSTTVAFGGDPENRFITTYFRRTFPIVDPDAISRTRRGHPSRRCRGRIHQWH